MRSGLNEEQAKEAASVMATGDMDGNGVIDSVEWHKWIKKQMGVGDVITFRDVQNLVKQWQVQLQLNDATNLI